jgi:NADPH-dependent curcumin reductase CurA
MAQIIGAVGATGGTAVSTAAGSVGSCVWQIAHLNACRTVGITGGAAKRELCLQRFGFEVARTMPTESHRAEFTMP